MNVLTCSINEQFEAMNIKDEDLFKLTKVTSEQIEIVTCVACCKFYIAPETAPCGHTLCHNCWRGRLKCAFCAKPIERRFLKHNRPIQDLTEHVHALSDAFEKLFNVKVAEFLMEAEPEHDSTKNVIDWLASSQNQFSAPADSSERSSREMALPGPINISLNKIQIHSTSKLKNSEKVVCVSNVPQDDWDKIEPMPDTEDITKDKENIVGPMDIEPFYIDDEAEYTVTNPRRSSRKRDVKADDRKKIIVKKAEDQNSKNSSNETDKKSSKAKQNWNSVKRMRKEFSKLNKKNRSKLNVSIQMCKKTKNTTNTVDGLPQAAVNYDIDENTPNVVHDKEMSDKNTNIENMNPETNSLSHTNTNINPNNNNAGATSSSHQGLVHDQEYLKTNTDIHETNLKSINPSQNQTSVVHLNPKNIVKSPFYKMSSLRPTYIEEKPANTAVVVKPIHNVIVDSNANTTTKTNDDIEITIKVANTVANILIKRKNDLQFKINTDREIQTSLDSCHVHENYNYNSLKNSEPQNIVINVGENNDVQVNHQGIDNPRIKELKKNSVSGKTGPDKKHTDSADTATAQFEITDSVEKELSKIMEFEDMEEKEIPSSSTATKANKKYSKNYQSQKSAVQPSDYNYINDLDMFDSESVKEPAVQLLKNTEHAASEILHSTVKKRNKTQNVNEKRHKNSSDEDLLPASKKAKRNDDDVQTKENHIESDSMNYDVIMDTVFANIDAEIEQSQQSRNKTHISNGNHKEVKGKNLSVNNNKRTQDVILHRNIITSDASQIISKNCSNKKDSENVFSIDVTKDNDTIQAAPTSKMMPLNVPPSNEEDFLTPMISQAANEDQIMDDSASDKSVVEETPQKNSFTKQKQKSNGATKEGDQSQRIDIPDRVSSKKNSPEFKNSIVNLIDSSEKNDVTTVNIVGTKPTETPLCIDRFVDHIQHNSTPLAKKSLNFDSEIVDDITLCPTNDVAKTTQEKEFMIKAFEKTPTAPSAKPQGLRSLTLKHKKYVVAGSALTHAENANLRKLCARNKWSYVDKYTKDVTHLVVGVDDENKAQRTVKYMCALAASIWIIAYEWVEKSLLSKDSVSEESFEVLDSTGHAGPMRSRTANKKLFEGISFFCLEPFSILDVDTFKGIIKSAGGRVVDAAAEVKVTDKSTAPAMLLAEPENTQEDRFVYLAMQLCIVPVNYEWVLNCLGSYTLTSIHDLLLCPASLLPKAIQKWPQELLARDEDDE